MDALKRIDWLSNYIDGETRSCPYHGQKLLLLGDKDSIFLKAVKRKADSFGITCDFNTGINPPYMGVVADREHPATKSYPLTSDVDIDNLRSPGMSCVAQGVFALLLGQGLVSGKTVTIVGRGPAVKGLAQALIAETATVTVAHSKTRDLFKATEGRDVVIYATPTLTQYPSFDTKELVIDIGNCLTEKDRNLFECPVVNRIGKLTVSIVLHRFMRCG